VRDWYEGVSPTVDEIYQPPPELAHIGDGSRGWRFPTEEEMPGLNKPRREGGYTAYEIAWAKKRYTEQLAIQEAEDDAILKKKLDAEKRKLREHKLK